MTAADWRMRFFGTKTLMTSFSSQNTWRVMGMLAISCGRGSYPTCRRNLSNYVSMLELEKLHYQRQPEDKNNPSITKQEKTRNIQIVSKY